MAAGHPSSFKNFSEKLVGYSWFQPQLVILPAPQNKYVAFEMRASQNESSFPLPPFIVGPTGQLLVLGRVERRIFAASTEDQMYESLCFSSPRLLF